MRKNQLAKSLARRAGVTKAEAADQLDRVVHQILSDLRKGQPAPLPGLGHFEPGKTLRFEFDKNNKPEESTHGKP